MALVMFREQQPGFNIAGFRELLERLQSPEYRKRIQVLRRNIYER